MLGTVFIGKLDQDNHSSKGLLYIPLYHFHAYIHGNDHVGNILRSQLFCHVVGKRAEKLPLPPNGIYALKQ